MNMAPKFNEKQYHDKILNGFRAGFKQPLGSVYMKQVRDQIEEGTYVDRHFDKEYMLRIWQAAFDEKEERRAKVAQAKNNKRIKELEESED